MPMQQNTDRAKLFMTGGSQAVRLPKSYRFDGVKEVRIYREGDRVVLEPEKPDWSEEFIALAGSAPDFPLPEEPLGIDPGPDFDPLGADTVDVDTVDVDTVDVKNEPVDA